MNNRFFERPVLNSPYEYPKRHWELDKDGQPTQQIIENRRRTHDQMVQAARSGVQNIAEGSQVSGTSKKMEMKLTNVARASLEELRLDYEDFLRQRGLEMWQPKEPALMRFKARRCSTVEEVRSWIEEERKRAKAASGQGQTLTGTENNNEPNAPSVPVSGSPEKPVPYSVLVANAVLSLLNVCCHLLSRQLAAQAAAFEKEGGFTERLYRSRNKKK